MVRLAFPALVTFRHAVETALVAPVGDRDAQVINFSSKRVHFIFARAAFRRADAPALRGCPAREFPGIRAPPPVCPEDSQSNTRRALPPSPATKSPSSPAPAIASA